jgi:hypothetical protein
VNRRFNHWSCTSGDSLSDNTSRQALQFIGNDTSFLTEEAWHAVVLNLSRCSNPLITTSLHKK